MWGGGGAQNFALFSSFSRPPFRFFFFSLGVFSWNFGVVVCEPRWPGLVGPPGFHTTAREPKRAHFRVPTFGNTTKIPKSENGVGEGRKRAKFWAFRRRGVQQRSVLRKVGQGSPNQQPQQPEPQQRQTLNKVMCLGVWGFGPFRVRKFGQNTKTVKLAKVGLAKVAADACFFFSFVFLFVIRCTAQQFL